MASIAVQGMIWAPLADVSVTGATVNGTLLGKSLQGSGSTFSLSPFLGALP